VKLYLKYIADEDECQAPSE